MIALLKKLFQRPKPEIKPISSGKEDIPLEPVEIEVNPVMPSFKADNSIPVDPPIPTPVPESNKKSKSKKSTKTAKKSTKKK